MKKIQVCAIAVLTLLIAILPIAGLAQEKRGDKIKAFMENTTPAERADLQTDLMIETLELSDEQVEKVRAVNLEYAEKTAAVYKSKESRLKKLREIRALHNDREKELNAVLTEEQREKYEKNKQEMRERMKKKRQSQS